MELSSVVQNFIDCNELNSSDGFQLLSELLEQDGHDVRILNKAVSEFRELECFFKHECKGFGIHAKLRNEYGIFYVNFYITRRLKGFPWIRVLSKINNELHLNSYPTTLVTSNHGFLRTMCYEYEFKGCVIKPSSSNIDYDDQMRLWIRNLNLVK